MTEFAVRTFTIFLIFFSLSFLYIYGNNSTFILFIYILTIYSFYEWIAISTKHILIVPIFIILISLLDYSDFIDIYYLSIATLLFWIIQIYFMIFFSTQLKEFIKKYFITLGLFIFSSFFLISMNMYPYDVTMLYDNSLIDNKHYILLLIALVSCVDIFSYISGKVFGTKKITSFISPNKTFEGYLGGYALTVLLFILLFNMNNIIWTYLDLFYLTTFILLAFFGDLYMSFIKRIHNVKDMSNILPGHGGVLDRLDSYFPALPLFYLWLMT